MAWTEQQNFAIVRTELDRVFMQNFEYDTTIPGIATARTAELFKPMQIDRAAYIEEIYAGSQLAQAIGETQTIPQSTPVVANKLTTYVLDYGNSVELSKDLFDDNMHGVWSKTVADFAMKALRTQDNAAFGWFRNAFTSSLTADGNAFCGTHTLVKGGTVVNFASGAGSALSGTSIQTNIQALAEQKDQSGVILGSTPYIMLVPPALFVKARQESDSALYADNSNNSINVYRSVYGFMVYQSPYLGAAAGGSDTAWFMLARNHSVTRIIRQGITTALRDWTMSNNRTYLYQYNFREVVYAPDYVGVYGNVGV